LRGESPLGERAIPLRCRCCHGVGEVEGAHNVASLPASIRWGVCLSEEVGSVWYVSDPCALDGARTNG
jgi:hypothetical protein